MFECLFTNEVVVGSNPFAVHIPVSFLKHEIADRRHSILLQVNHQSNAFDKSLINDSKYLVIINGFLPFIKAVTMLQTIALSKTTLKFRKNILKVI